ncbi:MAG TPA: hypothetical protein VMF08_23165 [Candidatus Sulfotelmatobacter sp.]|nr:hypothetical protein [Candidatus Sulfotelmatobacter sp.]
MLWKFTGGTNYFDDALLAVNFTRCVLSWDSTLPASGDAAGFNGIFMRWTARFLSDARLWPQFYGWMSLNADAAWDVRRTDNLSWQDWTSPRSLELKRHERARIVTARPWRPYFELQRPCSFIFPLS